MVKIPNETRRRRCPTRNARRCAFWGFEKYIYIYTYRRVYRKCVCLYIYIYMGTECIPIKTERKTLVPPPPPTTRLLPLNRKKILLNFQLVNPSFYHCNVYTDTAVIVRSFFFLPTPRTKVVFDFSHRWRRFFSGRVLLTVSNDLAGLSGPIVDRLGMRFGQTFESQ